jgi:hypothetical protein
MTEETTQTTIEELETNYPGIDLAYPIAVQSYEVGSKRLEIMDGRLQTILAFVATVTGLFPAIVGKSVGAFRSPWFYAAACLFVSILILGTAARLFGKIKVLEPNQLFDHWLRKHPLEFKKDFIAFAGDALDDNLDLANKKWLASVVIIGLFAAEVVLLVVWAALV